MYSRFEIHATIKLLGHPVVTSQGSSVTLSAMFFHKTCITGDPGDWSLETLRGFILHPFVLFIPHTQFNAEVNLS